MSKVTQYLNTKELPTFERHLLDKYIDKAGCCLDKNWLTTQLFLDVTNKADPKMISRTVLVTILLSGEN